MSQLFYLSAEQLERIKPFFPLLHGIPRVDDLKVISGIIYVIKHGLQWIDAPREYGLYKMLYNRFSRWSRKGVFNNIFTEMAKTARKDGRLMIDAAHYLYGLRHLVENAFLELKRWRGITTRYAKIQHHFWLPYTSDVSPSGQIFIDDTI